MKAIVKYTIYSAIALFLTFFSCGERKGIGNENRISDAEEYYKMLLAKNSELRKKINLENKNYFFMVFENYGDLNNMLIVREDSCFRVVMDAIDSEFSAEFPDSCSNYACERPLNFSPLESLFEYATQEPIVYTVVDENYDDSTHYGTGFVLCDSLGNIKLLADDKTLMPTQEYYRENYRKYIPINYELDRCLFELIFDLTMKYGDKTERRSKYNKSKLSTFDLYFSDYATAYIDTMKVVELETERGERIKLANDPVNKKLIAFSLLGHKGDKYKVMVWEFLTQQKIDSGYIDSSSPLVTFVPRIRDVDNNIIKNTLYVFEEPNGSSDYIYLRDYNDIFYLEDFSGQWMKVTIRDSAKVYNGWIAPLKWPDFR